MALAILDENDTITVADSDLVDGGDPETTYTVRVLTSPVMKRLRRESAKKRPTGRVTAEEPDAEKLTRLVIDYMLVSWEGIVVKGSRAPVAPDQIIHTSEGPLAAKYVVIDSDRYQGLLKTAMSNEVLADAAESFRGAS